MLKVKNSGQFRKDYKKCIKRGLNMDLLKSVVAVLAIPEPLQERNWDHNLTGNYVGYRECHVLPDWLLIYRVITVNIWNWLEPEHIQIYLTNKNLRKLPPM